MLCPSNKGDKICSEDFWKRAREDLQDFECETNTTMGTPLFISPQESKKEEKEGAENE